MPTFKVVQPGDLASPWSRYAVMSRDYAVAADGGGDGLLTRNELRQYIEQLAYERADAVDHHEPTDVLDTRLAESHRLLRDMDLVDADAVAYLPEGLKDLPERLKRRATEVLMLDDEYGVGEIDRQMLESARNRYLDMHPASLAMLNSRNGALNELNELARVLGLE